MPATDDPDVTVSDKARYRLVEPVVNHYQAAFEANNQPVPSNVVVRMIFAGYRPFGDEQRPMFAFTYTPMVVRSFLPIHNHASNRPEDGGFAFSVYHPGTSLPQQPWRL